MFSIVILCLCMIPHLIETKVNQRLPKEYSTLLIFARTHNVYSRFSQALISPVASGAHTSPTASKVLQSFWPPCLCPWQPL